MSMFTDEQDTTLEELTSLVDEYCHLQYYNHVERACEEFLAKQQSVFAEFWHAFALDMQASHTQALREMKKLRSDQTVALAATAALISIHKNAKSKDKEEMKALRGDFSDLSKNASADGLVFAARYFLHSGKAKQAKQCIDKVVRAAEMDVDKLNTAGLVYSHPDFPIEKAYEFFEDALDMSRRKPLASLFGRAKCYLREKDFIPALKDLNQVVVRYTNFPIGLVEKARVLMIQGNWDEAMQTVERVLLKQRFNIDALMINVAYMLVRQVRRASSVFCVSLLGLSFNYACVLSMRRHST
jgi:tetratricopeptide (TPR) repeat protein